MKKPSTLLRQKNKPNLTWLVFFIILILFILACYLSLRFGAVNYSQDQLWQVLSNPFKNSAKQDIIIDLRLPRLLAAILVGAAMAQA
ncbi:iron chelate uptake ABC transporter family permease subunit, partial [Streptococcus sobrinus]